MSRCIAAFPNHPKQKISNVARFIELDTERGPCENETQSMLHIWRNYLRKFVPHFLC